MLKFTVIWSPKISTGNIKRYRI